MPGPRRQQVPEGTGGGYLDGFGAGLTGSGSNAPVERTANEIPLGGEPVFGRNPTLREAERGFGGIKAPGLFEDGYTEVDVQLLLRGMPPEKVAQVKRQLMAGGLLSPETRVTQFVDSAMRNAFGELLTMANTRSSSYEAVLAGLARGETTATELRKEAARKFAELAQTTRTDVYQASNPATLRQTVEQAFEQALGRKPNKDEAEKFVNGFLSTERANQAWGFEQQDIADADARQRAMQGALLEADPLGATGAGPDGIDAFMSAMSSQESGGNYNATNGRTGASGRFQIMPSNWPGWSEEAGLGRNAPRTPENQDKVAKFKMQEYYNKFGSWDAVAVAWYAGEDDAAIWLKNRNDPRFKVKHGRAGKKNEPSINEYVSSVMGKLGSAGGTPKAKGAGGKAPRGNPDDPNYGQNLVTVNLGGKKATVHKEAAEAFQGFVAELVSLGYNPGEIGSYNNRNIRGTNKKSEHAYGYAIDIDPALNPEGGTKHALPGSVSQIAAKYGLKWGGDFKSRSPDYMHFEYVGGGGGGTYAAGGAAPLSRSVTAPVAQDAGAEAFEYARNKNPTETRAVDINGQFQSFMEILSRGVI